MLGRRGGYPFTGGWEAGKQGSREALTRFACMLRQVSGMPRYSDYLSHMRGSHPQGPVLSEREYFDEYVRTRYGDGPTRCC